MYLIVTQNQQGEKEFTFAFDGKHDRYPLAYLVAHCQKNGVKLPPSSVSNDPKARDKFFLTFPKDCQFPVKALLETLKWRLGYQINLETLDSFLFQPNPFPLLIQNPEEILDRSKFEAGMQTVWEELHSERASAERTEVGSGSVEHTLKQSIEAALFEGSHTLGDVIWDGTQFRIGLGSSALPQPSEKKEASEVEDESESSFKDEPSSVSSETLALAVVVRPAIKQPMLDQAVQAVVSATEEYLEKHGEALHQAARQKYHSVSGDADKRRDSLSSRGESSPARRFVNRSRGYSSASIAAQQFAAGDHHSDSVEGARDQIIAKRVREIAPQLFPEPKEKQVAPGPLSALLEEEEGEAEKLNQREHPFQPPALDDLEQVSEVVAGSEQVAQTQSVATGRAQRQTRAWWRWLGLSASGVGGALSIAGGITLGVLAGVSAVTVPLGAIIGVSVTVGALFLASVALAGLSLFLLARHYRNPKVSTPVVQSDLGTGQALELCAEQKLQQEGGNVYQNGVLHLHADQQAGDSQGLATVLAYQEGHGSPLYLPPTSDPASTSRRCSQDLGCQDPALTPPLGLTPVSV